MDCERFTLLALRAGRQCLLAGTFLLLGVQSLQALPKTVQRDYVLPEDSRGGFIYSPSKTESGQSANQKQSTVSYVAFDGSSYQLQPRAGQYVTLLLPATAAGKEPFTEDHIEELVDRLDILYANYRDLMQAEPQGSGAVTIAFVTETCGPACGLIGGKGIEVRTTQENFENIISDLEHGRLDDILNHEMAHNFDLYSSYLSYLPDHAHAWTEIFEYFAPYRYAHDSNNRQLSEDQYRSPASSIWQPYLADSEANWEACVRDQLCRTDGFPENRLWAMIYYRMDALHGIDAIKNSFAFLKSYVRSNAAPATAQEKEDLRLMSLATGAGTNIACYLENLKWTVSPQLETDLRARFGDSDALCSDIDKDGYSLITGDCDDHDAARSPGLREVDGNGVDDDCDETTDELTVRETAEFDLPGYSSTLKQQPLPLEISGRLSGLKDRDDVKISLPPNGRIRVKLCTQADFSGWVVALQPNGQTLQSEYWFEYLDAAGCKIGTFDFADLNSGILELQVDQAAGEYALTISAAENLPAEYSPLIQAVPRASGGVELVVSDADGQLAALGADTLELWVSGAGISFRVPYRSTSTVTLTSTSAPKLRSGQDYQARLRPLRNGQPLASYSAGHLFRYHATAQTTPRVDGGYSGAWFDPSHEGEGFIVEVLEHQQALVYWFTYAADGGQRWMLGLGDVQGNTIVVRELLGTHGGRFGDEFDPQDVVFETLGSLSITFQDCGNAVVNYAVTQTGDHQSLKRLTEVYGHRCGKSSENVDDDFSGSWYDPAHEGEGYIVEQLSAAEVLVFWFSYTSSGDQAWMLSTGSIADGRVRINELLQPSGGHFGRSFQPATVSMPIWGSLELDLDCSGGEASYETDLAAFADGRQQLIPLTRLENSGCAN